MDFTWALKYATEFLGTAILIILGNGAVANVELKGTKGHKVAGSSSLLVMVWGL
ncbi:glycerol facilitator-aquaporin [Streptococcus pneumoniae]|nr:glycerol facilitator-aquaporin [Streptococcus pneumoniae]